MDTAPAVIPAPQPMTRTERGLRRRQSGEVSQHALEPHVPRNVRSLDFAGDVKGQDPVRKTRDSHGGVHALARVDDVALADPGRRVAAVRDQHFRNGRDAVDQEAAGRERYEHSATLPGNRSSKAGDRGQRDEHLLRVLRSHPGDQEQARAERASDGPQRVGGIDAGKQPGGSCPLRARPPQAPTGSSRPTEASAATEPKTRGRGRAES